MKDETGRVLVAGAGVSGIRACLDLAQMGIRVLLIDKADHMGGFLSQLDTQFPAEGCGFCRSLPMLDRDRSSQHCARKGVIHENVEVLLSTRIMSIEGDAGDFTITLKQAPSMIDPLLCTGCGECEKVCPVAVDHAFNAGLTKRKAVYLPLPQSFSNAWTIDSSVCTRCGECEKVCPAGAIGIREQDRAKFKILVVDDEKIVRDSMEEWLVEEGFSVATADSGLGALAIMEQGIESDRPFSMMLTDIKMPGMDGVELLARAKGISPDLTVIMMTAYAAVDSAVDAMKQGALDYLTKPFDPEVLLSMTLQVYQEFEMAKGRVEKVNAVILAGGTRPFEPEKGKNPYGYGTLPGVVTSLEFERMLSPTGPGGMDFLHPATAGPVGKLAWFQCVGSRDIQEQAPFCSSACCMISIKQAVLAKKTAARSGRAVDTVIFFMDMRTMGKAFDRYRQKAEQEHGVSFVRARIHSLSENESNGKLVTRYTDLSGKVHEDEFDLGVLALGARPGRQMDEIARKNNIELNPWGFMAPLPFSQVHTSRQGVLAAGTVTGFRDISEAVTSASAAAMGAVQILQSVGRSLWERLNGKETAHLSSLSRENPRIGVVLCCGSKMDPEGFKSLKRDLEKAPDVVWVENLERGDPKEAGTFMSSLSKIVENNYCNRLILGAQLPHGGADRIKALAEAARIPSRLIKILDLGSVRDWHQAGPDLSRALGAKISNSRFINPLPQEILEGRRPKGGALVIGGGIAGMTAALCLADAGFHVDLVEKGPAIGGNLIWMDKTMEGHDIRSFLEDRVRRVESHENIVLYTNTSVEGAVAVPGGFTSFLSQTGQEAENHGQGESRDLALAHAVTILATGGSQTPLPPEIIGKPAELTQKEFQTALNDGRILHQDLDTVVMVQCSGTRDGRGRNYCSRVCCIRALKTALDLKEKKPGIQVFILYRDLMSYGFYETGYARAKDAGVIFFQYDPDHPPVTEDLDGGLTVTVRDHVLGRPVKIETDAVIHATGIESDLPPGLAQAYGADLDEFNFFKEADYKFRPVDSMNYRVFSCGLSLKPCTIEEAVTSAEAAASRALQILGPEILRSGRVVARTKKATCAVCGLCVDACPFKARSVDPVEDKILIDPAACQGCGVCATVCPSDSAVLEGFDARQMLDTIDQLIMNN